MSPTLDRATLASLLLVTLLAIGGAQGSEAPGPTATHGMVAPAAAALGVSCATVLDASFLFAALGLALAAWWWRGGSTTPAITIDRRAQLACVVFLALGIALRVWRASGGQDGDETWAFPSATPIFADTHDAWVHPPLGRALALLWANAIDWTHASGIFLLRLPSVLLSVVGLSLLCVLCMRRASREAAVAVLVIAVASAAIDADRLARPYALVGFAWACLVIATSEREASRESLVTAGLAVVSCAWTDVIAGAFAVAWLVVWAARSPDRARITTACAAVVGCIALVPGALAAVTGHLEEAVIGMHADLRPDRGRWLFVAVELIGSLAPGGWMVLGPVVVGVTLALAWRRRARVEAVFAAAALVAMVGLVLVVELRPRNVAFIAWILAAVWLARNADASPTTPARSHSVE